MKEQMQVAKWKRALPRSWRALQVSAPPAPSQDSLRQIGKQVWTQLQPRFPGDEAILSCSFVFQGQMVFASLTFTADVGLHWLFYFLYFHSFSPCPTCVPHTTLITLAGRQLDLSAGAVYRKPRKPSSRSWAFRSGKTQQQEL